MPLFVLCTRGLFGSHVGARLVAEQRVPLACAVLRVGLGTLC